MNTTTFSTAADCSKFIGFSSVPQSLPWLTNINRLLGQRVTSLRSRWRISSGDLASNLGISNAHLEDIEHGREAVDLVLLSRIAGELRVSMADLLQGM